MTQLEMFPIDGRPSWPELLTIAEAAQRARCCERTIRRAIETGALRAGRVCVEPGKRGGFRIRPGDLDAWLFGDGA